MSERVISATLVDVRKLLDERHRRALFARGYLLTTHQVEPDDGFPFWGNWSATKVQSWRLHTHAQTSFYIHEMDGGALLLIGHAYDPFNGTMDEASLLAEAGSALERSEEGLRAVIDNWTGRFALFIVRGKQLDAVQDCAGMRTVFYGHAAGRPFVTSHAQLAADLWDLKPVRWIRELVASREYRIGIRFLPGDMSAYEGVKRLGPNLMLRYRADFSLERFFVGLRREADESGADDASRVAVIAAALQRSLEMSSRKWETPAISLTGGTDSQTTLAAARTTRAGWKFFTFSSSAEEANDLEAAKVLAERLSLQHETHSIPDSGADIEDYEAYAAIVWHNSAYVRANGENDLRKLAYFANASLCEVDVKSWVSEIGRAYFCKRLGVNKLPDPLSPRQMSILYKRIAINRSLLWKVDSAISEWVESAQFRQFEGIDQADMVYWEHRLPGWGALCLNEFDMCWETTLPFNNRRLMEMFLAFPRDKRLSDYAHKEVIRSLDPGLADSEVHVLNYSKKGLRVAMERVFFEVNSRLP